MSLMYPQQVLTAIAATSVAVLLSACSVSPVAIDKSEVGRRVAEDKSKMFADQEAIRGAMAFPEVAARALKYNLDYRVRLMEEAVAQGLLDVSSWEMFPRLLANAGYTRRNNDQGGYSRLIPGGTPSTTASQTVDSSRRLANVEFAWNILDFGVSYYRAKIAADQVLIAEERKRKVMQNLMQDTRNAYWRALGAQRLLGQMDSLMQRSNLALARARQIEQQGLLPQAQALAYQRALLDSTTLLQVRRQDLELAKAELSSLMNLQPGTEFLLADEAEDVLPPLPANISALEDMALNQRPELREEDYRKRISANDAKRAIVSLLPGVEFNMNLQRDSNSLLLNKNWIDTGFRLSANLFKLASMPTVKRSQEAQKQLDDTRRMAQAMAVLTQVRVASLRYGLAKDELGTTNDSANVDQRLANYAKASATSRVDSELEVIRTEARALLSNYQRHIAYSNAQAAWGRLFNSVGYDIAPAEPGASVAQLAEVIKRSITEWQVSTFGRAAAVAPAMPTVAINLTGLRDREQKSAVTLALIEALAKMDIQVSEPGKDVWTIDVKTVLDQRKSGNSSATWEMVVKRPSGSIAGKGRYTSDLPGDSLVQSLAAMSQSALMAYGSALAEWMDPGESKFAETSTNSKN
jgi:outer membrane protein TolC